jgi:hypothetical protein
MIGDDHGESCDRAMLKKGIKVKELARELGVTSRIVVDSCREAGWEVQNSVTRLTLHQAEQIRTQFRSTGLTHIQDGETSPD